MTAVLNAIQIMEFNWKIKLQLFTAAHPYIAVPLAIVLVPLMLVLAVSVTTCVVVFPIAWIFGLY